MRELELREYKVKVIPQSGESFAVRRDAYSPDTAVERVAREMWRNREELWPHGYSFRGVAGNFVSFECEGELFRVTVELEPVFYVDFLE